MGVYGKKTAGSHRWFDRSHRLVRMAMLLGAMWSVLICCSSTGWAQGRHRPAGEDNPKTLMETKFEAIKQRILRNRVGLDETTTEKVSAIIAEFAPKRRAIRQKLIEKRLALKELLRKQVEDQNAYAQHLDEMEKLRKDMVSVHEQEMDALRKLLTPKQRAILWMEIQHIQKQIGKALKKRGMKGRGWPGLGADDDSAN